MTPEKPSFEQKGLKGIKVIERELEERGYKIINQEPYQDSVDIEGQKVKLPFTNMGRVRVVIAQNYEGKWEVLMRNHDEKRFEEYLRELHEKTS